MTKLGAFINLANLFNSHGYRLFLVGGSVRDFLFNKELSDLDVVSDATPEQIISFLKNVDQTFARFGSLKYIDENNNKFDITTLRMEKSYQDYRHPNEVIFVKDLTKDYVRRDFTINALYMDKDLKIYDYTNGQNDLNNHLLRMVGDPNIRLKEDPLRILRAIRFSLMFDLDIEPNLYIALKDNFGLLKQIQVHLKIKHHQFYL